MNNILLHLGNSDVLFLLKILKILKKKFLNILLSVLKIKVDKRIPYLNRQRTFGRLDEFCGGRARLWHSPGRWGYDVEPTALETPSTWESRRIPPPHCWWLSAVQESPRCRLSYDGTCPASHSTQSCHSASQHIWSTISSNESRVKR